MLDSDLNPLTPEQQAMVDLWEQHLQAEFVDKDAEASCNTMVEHPFVNHVPTLAGGYGRPQLEHFYGQYFIPHMPDDVEQIPISRTVGQNRIVDEFIFRCTHSTQIDWLLPGVPPTGRRLELAFVVIIAFEEGKMRAEHIYWDQGSAMAQVGLIDASKLPVVGAEGARKMLDPAAAPSNALIKRTINDDRL